jgi:hypothetical protein
MKAEKKYLINYKKNNAELVILIGNKNYIKKGVGKEVITFGFYNLYKKFKIKEFILGINLDNICALKLYKSIDFKKFQVIYFINSIKIKWVIC